MQRTSKEMVILCLFLVLPPYPEINMVQEFSQAFGFSLVPWWDFAPLYVMCDDSPCGGPLIWDSCRWCILFYYNSYYKEDFITCPLRLFKL